MRHLLLSAALLLGGFASAHGQQIGVVSSLQPNVAGTPPGAGERVLAIGLDVIANERITSSDTGRGQLLFTDRTSLTIAPNSDLVLDKFVYDPARGSGEIALSLTKGALRFIGGQITKQSDGVITTPTATIGIRGGIALIDLTGGNTKAILVAGEYICLEAGTERHCASRHGAILTEAGYQGVASAEVLENLLRTLDGVFPPEVTESFFTNRSTGADDVGSFDRPDLSTTGEERDIVIFEDLPQEDLFNDRGFGDGIVRVLPEPPDPPMQEPPGNEYPYEEEPLNPDVPL